MKSTSDHQLSKKVVATLCCLVIFFTLSCSISSSSNQSLEQTKAALDIMMTVAANQAGQDLQATSQSSSQTEVAANIQATVIASQATQLALQSNQPVTTNPPPILTEPPPVESAEPPAEVNVDEKIKNAKILLFESMAGTGELELVQEALDMGGYAYKDDGSAEGWFKDDLLATTSWDLIIAANEVRRKIQGEYFDYLMTQINKGNAVIIEHWDIDDLSQGKVAPILSKCGVGLYKDWFIPFGAVPNLAVWSLQPDHPIFHEPIDGISLRRYGNFWSGDTDRGDLLKITGGDATMLMGTIATSKMDHGTLVTCLGGRVILQTHSSHEYSRDQITALWQNMIYYTLKNHFLYQQ
jgi:hypothetical protein